MNNRLVSIVIPCYKGEAYLAEALDSCLAQTYRKIEIIVVDDASPDRCADIADEYASRDTRIRVLRHEHNGGVARAFNTGYQNAKGDFFTRLAQDDVFEARAIEMLVGYLQSHPSVSLAYANCMRMDALGNLMDVEETAEPEYALKPVFRIGLCIMWTRSAWEETGEFDPTFTSTEDYEYWLRLSQHHTIAKLASAKPLLKVRVHAEMGSRARQPVQMVEDAIIRCKYFIPVREHSKTLAEAYYDAGWLYRGRKQYHQAFQFIGKAIVNAPCTLLYYKALLGTCAKWARHGD